MRFSVLHLLLGTALAVPIQDLAQASKRSEEEGLIARGLVPIIERSPVFIAPKPVVPKPVKPPVNGPDAPVGPKPPVNGPDAPAPDTPAPLVPGDPVTPPKDTPDQPGLVPPADEPKPAPPPADTKPPANQADDPNAPKDKPDDSTPVLADDPDAPANLPESCSLKRGCIGSPPPFEGAPAQWKTTDKNGKTIDYRDKGYKTHKELDDVIAGGSSKEPKFAGNLEDGGRYVVNIKKGVNPPDQKYLQDPRWKDAFAQDGKFTEAEVMNNPGQVEAQTKWAGPGGDFESQLKKQGATDDDVMMAGFDQNLDQIPMARTQHNPEQGSLVVKASFNNEKDLYRKYPGETGENPATGKPFTYERPGFGDKSQEVGWSDQMMGNHRQAAADAGVDVKNLRYIAQDDITNHAGTREVIDGVLDVMKAKQGEMVTLRRTGGSAEESAAFDALAGTVHGQRPIQMVTDHHVELGNPTVDAFHVMKSSDNRYDMMAELGRAA